jgi:hypothetical protein
MSDEEPILWDLEFVWHHSLDTSMAEGKFRARTSVDFTVKTDIDRSLAKRNDTATVGGKIDADAPKVTWNGEPGSGGAQVSSLSPSRRFDTGLPALKGDDDPAADQPMDSFKVSGTITAPQLVVTRVETPQGEKTINKTVLVPWKAEFDFPYHPGEQQVHTDKKDLLDYLNKVIATAPPGVTLSNPEGSVQYTLRQKDLRLEFKPTLTDYTRFATYQDMTPVTTTLFYNKQLYNKKTPQSGETFEAHANYMVQVYVDNNPQVPEPGSGGKTAKFHIWRIVRNWQGPLDPETKLCGEYKTPEASTTPDKVADPAKINLPGGWILDYSDVKDWVDTPGSGAMLRPGTWGGMSGKPGNRSTILEYLVTVKDYPEFRFVYFYFIFDFLKNQYRVRTYAQHDVSLEEAKEIFNYRMPYRMSVDGPIETTGCTFCPDGSTKDWVTVQDP